MTNTLSLCLKNGAMTQYGNLQNAIVTMPSAPMSVVVCPDGSRKSRQDRLAILPNVPEDDRATEVTAALAFTSIIGFCFTTNVLGLDGISPLTSFLFFSVILIAIVDNFYGVIRGGINMQDKLNVELPEKDDLPLNLGSGSITGTVTRGLSRLLSVDTERECECEAAAFFAAYSLGLPCFAFRPNALEVCIPCSCSVLFVAVDSI